jgi:hypothetical protein
MSVVGMLWAQIGATFPDHDRAIGAVSRDAGRSH